MLKVTNLRAGYGGNQVLRGVSFDIRPGEIVALAGRNGSGRSTTARAIMGLVPSQGRVEWEGENILGLPPHAIARRGIGYVPENRDVFPTLTTQQNLMLGIQPPSRRQKPNAAAWTCQDMYALFPILETRARVTAGQLSGGEQQMLTLCRALMGNPRLLLIDEPTEGLAEPLVQQVGSFLLTLKRHGLAVLLIEQKQTLTRHLADRALIMEHGQIAFSGASDALPDLPLA